jgi:hypothetical protein
MMPSWQGTVLSDILVGGSVIFYISFPFLLVAHCDQETTALQYAPLELQVADFYH